MRMNCLSKCNQGYQELINCQSGSKQTVLTFFSVQPILNASEVYKNEYDAKQGTQLRILFFCLFSFLPELIPENIYSVKR